MAAKKTKKPATAPAVVPPAKRAAAPKPDTSAAWVWALWYLGAALTFWSFGYTAMRGSDLWWHLAGGRWMWEHGTAWVNDPFSYTAAGKEWLNDAWLSGVFLYLWAYKINLESLAYWKWAMIAVTWLLLFRVAWRSSGDPISSFAACVLSIAVAAPFLDVRPQLYSFLAWAVMLDMCIARERPSRWLPLVLLLWVNLHAGFFLGLISLPLLLLPHWLDAKATTRRSIVVLGVLSVAACLINPNGFEVVTRPLLHAFDTESPYRTLGEWLPPFEKGGIRSPLFPYGIAAFVGGAAVSLWTISKSRRRAAASVPIFVGALTLFMALQSRRFIPLFALTEVLVVGQALSVLIAVGVRKVPAYAPALAAALLGLWLMSGRPLASWAFTDLTARNSFPMDTCGFMKENGFTGKTFNYYNWGGFIQLCTNARMKVFIDGRAETVYDDATFLEYLEILHQRPGWEKAIADSGAEFVLWPLNMGSVVKELSGSSHWRVLYRDPVSVLFARADLSLPAELKPSPDSGYRDANFGMQQLSEGKPAAAVPFFERALRLDPHLFPACTALARSRALLGQFPEAHTVAESCGGMTSDVEQVDRLHAMIDSIRARAARK